MKTPVLLVFTVLLVLCHFANVTLGDPKLSESQVKVHDLSKSFEELDETFKAAEAYFKEAEEYFQTLKDRNPETAPPFVELPKTSKIHFFISIPDLQGKDHVYVFNKAHKLGLGASGRVYLAKDIKIPDKFVAIKVTENQDELKGLKLFGELLGSVKYLARSRWDSKLFLVMTFAQGITLLQSSEKTYNGRKVSEYWTDENNKGYHALLYRIARDIVAPMVNKYLIHKDLGATNIMVSHIDENYLPTESDPATGLQHFRAIDFGKHHKILDGEDILDRIQQVAEKVLCLLDHSLDLQKTIEIFKKDVVDALDNSNFDIILENGMLKSVRKKKGGVPKYVSKRKSLEINENDSEDEDLYSDAIEDPDWL